jgi:hypothetical protein
MNPRKYTGHEGRLIPAERASRITTPHQNREKEIMGRGETFVKAEFFGIHTFNELIAAHGKNCVGFRVYYGVGDEEDEHEEAIAAADKTRKQASRLVIVPVDENGKDLISSSIGFGSSSSSAGGLKDMPAEKEVMVGGPLCPRHC